MEYDAATKSFSNNTNVELIVPDFGGTGAFEYLDVGYINLGPYLHTMVEYFVKRGYKRDESIRGAPYDWRLAAGDLHNYRNAIIILYPCYSMLGEKKQIKKPTVF